MIFQIKLIQEVTENSPLSTSQLNLNRQETFKLSTHSLLSTQPFKSVKKSCHLYERPLKIGKFASFIIEIPLHLKSFKKINPQYEYSSAVFIFYYR